MTTIPSVKQLRRATEIAEQIEKLEQELRSVLGQEAPARQSADASAPAQAPKKRLQVRKKRTVSPEARAKMAAGQRKRWENVKGKGK